jgi:hypothetical protein
LTYRDMASLAALRIAGRLPAEMLLCRGIEVFKTGAMRATFRSGTLLEVRMKRTLCLTLLFLGAAILFSIGISIDSSRAADGSQITIVYGSNLIGYLEPCG